MDNYNWEHFKNLSREEQVDFLSILMDEKNETERSWRIYVELSKALKSQNMEDIDVAIEKLQRFNYDRAIVEFDCFENNMEYMDASEKYTNLRSMQYMLYNFIFYKDVKRGAIIVQQIERLLKRELKEEVRKEILEGESLNAFYNNLHLYINRMYALMINQKIIIDKQIIEDVVNFLIDHKEYEYLNKIVKQ